MPVVTLSRASNRAYYSEVPETETLLVGGLALSGTGTASLYADDNTTTITIGGGAAQTSVVIGKSGQQTRILGSFRAEEGIEGPDDGTGIVIGTVGTGASTGSALQVVTVTTTERGYLVPASGMVVFNSTTGVIEGYNGSTWVDLMAGAGGASSLSSTLAVGNTSGGNSIILSTGDSLVGADELTLVSTTTGTASLDSGTTGAVNVGTGAASKQVTLGSTTGTSGLTLRTGTNPLSVVAGGVFDVDVTGAITFDSSAAGISLDGITSSNFTVTGAAQSLTLAALGGGAQSVTLNSAGTSVNAIDLNASAGGVTIDSVASSNFTVTGAGQTLTLEAAGGTTNKVVINSAGTGADAVDINATAGGIDVDATGAVTIDSAGTASNFTLTANDAGTTTLTIQSTNSGAGVGNVLMTADGSLDLRAAVSLDISDDNQVATVNVGTGNAAKTVTVGSTNTTSSLTLQGGTGTVAITQAGGDAITVGQTGGAGTGSTLGVPSFTTAQLGTNLTATNGMLAYDTTEAEIVGRINGAWEPVGLAESAAATAASFSTTNATATTVTGLTLTEGTDFDGAGVYMVRFSGSGVPSGNNSQQWMTIAVGGTTNSTSQRSIGTTGGNQGSFVAGFCSEARVSVTAGQAVTAQLRSDGGSTAQLTECTLTVQRVR